MNKHNIFIKLLPGLLPIFIYIIVEEIYGTKIGLIAAVILGVIELIYLYIKEKQLNKFVLIDTSLLIFLGGFSIWMDNSLFFKLKPGFIQIIISAIIGLSAYSKINIMGVITNQYMKKANISTNKVNIKQMQNNLKPLFWIFLLHTLLVIYSSIYMSEKAWAFISGILIYIIFAIYFIIQLIIKKRRLN